MINPFQRKHLIGVPDIISDTNGYGDLRMETLIDEAQVDFADGKAMVLDSIVVAVNAEATAK
ncbi:hypothetical protein PG997_005749 [Apiospora hydei]|uniref:Uncharacterized protein n=1 Tax=Apiospora hydei TaxID=1337664 RepID=A0ABR1WLU1_9PEZI